jgi:hypothetical protein
VLWADFIWRLAGVRGKNASGKHGCDDKNACQAIDDGFILNLPPEPQQANDQER